jgi:RNA polymerase sigma factor for flagellar operon FliA
MQYASLWKDFGRGDARARDALLNAHLTLVYHVARQLGRRLSTRHEIDDLVSSGTMGLIDALDSFDVSRGLAFSTYAIPRIRGAILDELRREDHAPRSVRRKQRAIMGAREALIRVKGREATDGEIAEYLGIDRTTMRQWSAAAARATMLSIEESLTTDDGEIMGGLDEFTATGTADVDADVTREQEIRLLTDALVELTAQERHVLVLYYREELKMREVAVILGVTESRVSQVRTRALAKLRARLAPLRQPSTEQLVG